MKQLYNTTIYNTALYLRLSRDDEVQGESGSIQTQRMMLRQYAAEHGLTLSLIHIYELFSLRMLIAGTICFTLYQLLEPFITLWLGAGYILPLSLIHI